MSQELDILDSRQVHDHVLGEVGVGFGPRAVIDHGRTRAPMSYGLLLSSGTGSSSSFLRHLECQRIIILDPYTDSDVPTVSDELAKRDGALAQLAAAAVCGLSAQKYVTERCPRTTAFPLNTVSTLQGIHGRLERWSGIVFNVTRSALPSGGSPVSPLASSAAAEPRIT
ncbi:MAG TPA: hypothetical protein VG937_08085 [Polyangiaceae bacterium]|nr:hypothetical protein [Polyangiaceae bacterium]